VPKCPVCEAKMIKKKEGVYLCPKCKGVFVGRDVIKSMFGVT